MQNTILVLNNTIIFADLKTIFTSQCKAKGFHCKFKSIQQNSWIISQIYVTRGSVGWACVAHLSFCFDET
jgi:hypothetical protein